MPATDYSKPGPVRFAFEGMCTVCAPDAQPTGKFPLAINVHAFLDDAITPRLPQSTPIVTLVPSAAVHSLRRMNDNTGVLTSIGIGPNAVTVGTDIPVAGGTAWSNPGNITGEDGSYSSVTLTSTGTPGNIGPNSPSTVASVGSGGVWQTPSNAKVLDGVYAQAPMSGFGTSAFLSLTGYGFAVPAGATITGVVVKAYVQGSLAGLLVSDFNVVLTSTGTNIISANRANGTIWPSTPSTQTYGTSTDTWGAPLTPALVNSATFGVMISARNHDSIIRVAHIDYVSIQVYYTVFANVVSDLLQGTGFGFALAGGSQVAGIKLDIKGNQTYPVPTGGFSIQLLKAGVPVGTVKTGVLLPSTNGYVSFGSNSDLWGTTWTPADINAATFGFSLQVVSNGTGTWNIDYARITIYSYSSSPVTGYVLISGAADKLYVGSTQVDSGYSQNRLAMVPFRPDTSVRPWMYIGDSVKMSKVSSDGTIYKQGIKEPQTVPTLALAGGGPLTGTEFYAYSYRSSATGAKSNLSPISSIAGANSIVAAANSVLVTCTASTDPQADLIDVWRFGVGLLSYTYIATISNSAPTFTDNLSDPIVALNPVAEFDNFEPFPSIDVPQVGTLTVSAGPYTGTVTCTWATGNKFNLRWLPGTIVTLGSGTGATEVTLFARPTSTTVFVGLIQPPGAALANGTYAFSIPAPNLAAQPLQAFWGPTDEAAYMFAVGDPLRPGTLYFTKGNNPDSAPQTNQKEMTSPSEPLIGGAIVGGLGIVMSTERGWLIYPNFAQATATVIGVAGSPFTTVESISERGLWAKEGICTDGGGMMYFIAKDGIRESAAGAGSQSITDDIDNLFPHEGLTQKPYTIAGYTVSPPDYTQPDGMCLRFSQGYVYFDYFGLDAQRHTLKYHVRRKAWSVEQYPAVASVHADNEGQGTVGSPAFPAIGVLTGCADSTIRNLSTSAAAETGLGMVVLTPSYGGVARPIKHYGDLYLEYSELVDSQIALDLWSNRYESRLAGFLSPPTLPLPSSVYRTGQVVELNNGLGVYAQDIGLAITAQVAPPALSPDNSTLVYVSIYQWEPTLIEQPETIGQRVTDWDDAGYPGAKFVQGVVIEADTGGLAKVIQAQSGDDQSVHDLAEIIAAGTGAVFTNQTSIAFSFAQPFIAHNMRLVPTDAVPWRLFSVKWVYVPIPELCTEWHTESTGHGLKGWQHIKQVNIEHISTQDLTLTLVADTGAQVAVTIPNSGGTQAKTLVSIPAQWTIGPNPASPKFKLVAYNFTSTDGFRLWKEDMEVTVGDWGRDSGYTTMRPFGGQSDSQDAQV